MMDMLVHHPDMTDRSSLTETAAAERLRRWVRCSVVMKARWRLLGALLGPTEGQTCLEVGCGAVGAMLRTSGGEWYSADCHPEGVVRLTRLYGEHAQAIGLDGRLPFSDGMFDAVVVADTFESLEDEAPLVAEIHRTLKPAGRLVLEVPAWKASPLHALRRLLGFGDARLRRVRRGYRLPQLYEILKNGFDVQEVHGYGGFFAEGWEWMARWFAERWIRGPVAWTAEELALPEFRRLMRIYRLIQPAAVLGAALDRLMPFRGHRIALRAKRRLWIPRKTPVLRDGRSIAEATLRTRIGTASPLAELKRP